MSHRIRFTSVFLLAIVLGVSANPQAAFSRSNTSSAPNNDLCERDYNQCMDSCDRLPAGKDGSRRARCSGQCGKILMKCYGDDGTSAARTIPKKPRPNKSNALDSRSILDGGNGSPTGTPAPMGTPARGGSGA